MFSILNHTSCWLYIMTYHKLLAQAYDTGYIRKSPYIFPNRFVTFWSHPLGFLSQLGTHSHIPSPQSGLTQTLGIDLWPPGTSQTRLTSFQRKKKQCVCFAVCVTLTKHAFMFNTSILGGSPGHGHNNDVHHILHKIIIIISKPSLTYFSWESLTGLYLKLELNMFYITL